MIDFYSTVFCLLYMFRTNLVVHHQEHGIMYCITHTVQLFFKHDCTDFTVQYDARYTQRQINKFYVLHVYHKPLQLLC